MLAEGAAAREEWIAENTERCDKCGARFQTRQLPSQELCRLTEAFTEPVCAVCGHPKNDTEGFPIHVDETEPGGEPDGWCIACAESVSGPRFDTSGAHVWEQATRGTA